MHSGKHIHKVFKKETENTLEESGRKGCCGWNLYVSVYYKSNLQIVWLFSLDIE